MKKAKRAILLSVALLFVFAMLFSHFLILAEAEHDCAGEDCPVCLAISVAKQLLKGLSLLLLIAVSALLLPDRVAGRSRAAAHTLLSSTPISLKVKLTD